MPWSLARRLDTTSRRQGMRCTQPTITGLLDVVFIFSDRDGGGVGRDKSSGGIQSFIRVQGVLAEGGGTISPKP